MDLLSSTLQEAEHKTIGTIYFRPDVLDIPLFRPRDEQAIDTSTGRARGADDFGKMFAALGHRAGYPDNELVVEQHLWKLVRIIFR